MIYLKRFKLVSKSDEDTFLLSYPYQLEMQCFSHTNIYPFRIFPEKELEHITFSNITIFYGENGSGKSTLLNIIAEKLKVESSAPFNDTPYMDSYLEHCYYDLSPQVKDIPKESKKITSDDVFNFLLDIRTINQGVDRERQGLFNEYNELKRSPCNLRSLEEFEEFKKRNAARRQTMSQYTTQRMSAFEVNGKSNGESAFLYFTQKIKENAVYILDEPENSLSASLQIELSKFIENSARFYGCQFIISTHSPFLLAMNGAKIYDLDSNPVSEKVWTELKNVRIYYDFFKERM